MCHRKRNCRVKTELIYYKPNKTADISRHQNYGEIVIFASGCFIRLDIMVCINLKMKSHNNTTYTKTLQTMQTKSVRINTGF